MKNQLWMGPALALAMLSTACGGESAKKPSNVQAKLSENVATVVSVTWRTTEPTIGYVEYGPTRDLTMHTPLEATPTTDHKQLLLGMVADTEYFYRVVTWDGAAAGASGILTVTTGLLPGLPDLKLVGTGEQDYIITSLLGMKRAVTILNQEGKIVWYRMEDRMLDFYRTRLSLDGQSIIYNAAKISGAPSPDSELVRVSLDGATVTPIKVPFLAHDFVEHPDGTLAAMVVEIRTAADGTELRGDKIVEIAKDGTQTTVWTSWDCFDPTKDKSDDPLQGWTFANALDFDPVDNVYYLSMRNFSSITRINRTTRACEWVLGTTASTFTFAPPGAPRFLHEHQFQVRRGTDAKSANILVMDNDGAPGNESRILEYDLDLETKVATHKWTYLSTPSVYTFVLGEPIRYPDNSMLINWSAAGQMERLDSTGTSTWKLNTSAGYIFGFDTVASSLYPANAPMATPK